MEIYVKCTEIRIHSNDPALFQVSFSYIGNAVAPIAFITDDHAGIVVGNNYKIKVENADMVVSGTI